MIDEGVYGSGFPHPSNFGFLETLNLRNLGRLVLSIVWSKTWEGIIEDTENMCPFYAKDESNGDAVSVGKLSELQLHDNDDDHCSTRIPDADVKEVIDTDAATATVIMLHSV